MMRDSGNKRRNKMSIQTVVKQVSALFDSQKSVVRTNEDTKLSTVSAANAGAGPRVEQPMVQPFDLSSLAALSKPGPKKVAVIGAPVVADIADPPAPTQPAPTPVAVATPAPKPVAPVVATPQPVERPTVKTAAA